jgi:type II secretory pathway pseudopilin PulG
MKFIPANRRSHAVESEWSASFGVRRLDAAFSALPTCRQSRTAFERFGEYRAAQMIRRRQVACGKRGQVRALQSESGFTLAEVLAALLFMAIVIPVAVQGLQIASRAGSVSERKAQAARMAESKLNELIVTRQWSSSASRGTIQEGLQSYTWRLETQPWAEDGAMRLVTVWVSVPVQGQEYEVPVSTLVDAAQ